MESILSLEKSERGPYFEKAAEHLKMSPQIIEKDFWVCWVLGKLFTLPEIKDHLTFKGGTSLSKVYRIIERFSEDIDISVEKSYLGFINDRDPEKITGAKQRLTILNDLSDACKHFVTNTLLVAMKKEFAAQIQTDKWTLEIDPNDQDSQTILFTYPQSLSSLSAYVRPIVKIEVGARSEHWPVSFKEVNSYVKEALDKTVREDNIKLRVLNVERTFWEKATILHMYAHYPIEKHPPVRQSRHYYDFYCLLKSQYHASATQEVALLNRVAEHKSIYFRAAWASYATAKKGTLKLIPNERILNEMARDYELMAEMFFTTPPAWKDIVEEILKFETNFNTQI